MTQARVSAKPTGFLRPGSYERGSQWRRWDPHVHTPDSALANNFASWDEYIEALEVSGKDVAVIGITDYCTIEGYKKVLDYRKAGRLSSFEMVLPNIEFRMTPETKEGCAINIHLLIDPNDPDHVDEIERALGHLWFEYQGTRYSCTLPELIRLGRAHDSKQTDDYGALVHGINLFKPEFGVFKEWYESQAWLYDNSLVVVSNGKDGPGGLSKDAGFAGVREEIYRFSDLVFSGNPTDREYFLGKKSDPPVEVIRKNGSLKPCIHGSDAHDMKKLFRPDGGRFCWIKADPTFEGVRQLLHEPEDRVYIGPTSPTEIDDSKIIDSVEFVNGGSWFQKATTPLNAGLVGVIGEKGSGKTALAELIAFGARAWNESTVRNSSFIKKAKPYTHGMSVRLHWRDGHTSESKLDEPLASIPAEVRYLSQDFVEELCSEDVSGHHLIKRIEDVVFSHIEEAERLDASSFSELKQLRTESLANRKTTIKTQMARLNSEIVALEDQAGSKQAKERQIKKCDTDIAAIDKQLPTLKSTVDPKVEKALAEAAALLKLKSDELASLNRAGRLLQVAKDELEAYVEEVETSFEDLRDKLEEAGLTAAEIESFAPNFKADRAKPFIRIATEQAKAIEVLRGDPKKPNLKGETIADLTARVTELQKSLATDEKQRERLIALQKQREKAVAEKERLQKEVAKIDGPTQDLLRRKREARMKTYLSYFEVLNMEEETLKELYQPLEVVIADDPTGAKAGFELNVQQVVDSQEWLEAGRVLFDGRKKISPFQEKAKLDALELTLFEAWRVRDTKGIAVALEAFADDLAKEPKVMDSILNTHTNREKVYGWLFDTDHTRLEYSLRYEGTELNVLSPGTRGIVLLVLYLSMDTQDHRPLVIDQPEGNLDNASVYKSLVPFLRTAKKTRQIILVTHNPNLVVTTDADQVIVASADRQPGVPHPKLSYVSGSLENNDTADAIREQAIELLEGGPEPFLLRGDRYDLD